MRKGRLFFLVLVGIIFFTTTSTEAAKTLKFGGGAGGGAWFVSVAAGVKLLNKELKGKYRYQNVPSPSAVNNVRRLAKGEFDTAWADFFTVYHAWNGSELFQKDGKIRNFRIAANVRKHINIYVVLDDSPIKKLSDLKGKVVNLVQPGMSANTICVKSLTALGLINQIQKRNMGFAAGARALGDRQIDVFCSSGGPTLPVLIRLSHQKKIRFLSMTPEEQKKITGQYGMYSAMRTPGYKRLKGMEKPLNTVSFNAVWLVGKDMSNDAVYQMMKTTAEPKNLKRLVKVIRYWSRLSGRLSWLKKYKIYVHPAAARYWKERGQNIPPEIVKGF